ncbi:MAG: AraC family transcriptional regulator [Treponema sp.]|nr:AraC family transcriptional regulator [Treponema sp.]MCL2250758.1 AraC family transcriptional regulator [Treponema sp.]
MEPTYHYYFNNKFRPLASLSLHEIAGFSCPASYVLPIERPDSYAIYLVYDGKGIYTVNNKEFPVKENDIFVMYPDIPVSCVSDSKKPWELQAVSFDGVDARLLINAAGFEPKKPVRTLDPLFAENLVKLMAGIYVWKGQEIYSTVQSTALIYAMLAALARTATWDQSASPPGWTGTLHFQNAIDYISKNYSKPISVIDIAEHVNLSRSRLYRVFMQQIFISPQQYLIDYRIREAVRLLEKRHGSIKEISLAVGFEDPLYFSSFFKQVTGKSPKNYIKDITEAADSRKNDSKTLPPPP